MNRCSKEGVALVLPESGYVCVDCDSCSAFGASESKPDYIGLQDSDKPRWFVVEMKRSVRDPGLPIRQIRAGIAKLQSHPLFRIDGSPRTLVGIIVHGRGRTRTADISKYSVRFNGRPVSIVVLRSGERL